MPGRLDDPTQPPPAAAAAAAVSCVRARAGDDILSMRLTPQRTRLPLSVSDEQNANGQTPQLSTGLIKLYHFKV